MPNCAASQTHAFRRYVLGRLVSSMSPHTTVHRRIRVKSTNHIYTKIFELLGLVEGTIAIRSELQQQNTSKVTRPTRGVLGHSTQDDSSLLYTRLYI